MATKVVFSPVDAAGTILLSVPGIMSCAVVMILLCLPVPPGVGGWLGGFDWSRY